MRELIEMNEMIRKKIEVFAKEQGITYEEAVDRAEFTINGVKIVPVDASELNINIDANEEVDHGDTTRFD